MVDEILRRAHTTSGMTWGSILPTNKTQVEVLDATSWSRVATVVFDEDDEKAASAMDDLKNSESEVFVFL